MCVRDAWVVNLLNMRGHTESEALAAFSVVPYDPSWADWFVAEERAIKAALPMEFVHFEHIGSTAVPGLDAKPIIDIMAAVTTLADEDRIPPRLEELGYRRVPISMKGRILLRRRVPSEGKIFHLHIVEESMWDARKERIFRDYLRAHSDAAEAYALVKRKVSVECAADSLEYTRRKTAVIQDLMDRAFAERGMPSVNVWEE